MFNIKTAWAHLPNAAHIDRILTDVKRRPEVWGAALDAVWNAARAAARGAALDAVRAAAWSAAGSAAGSAALDAVRDAALDAAWDAVWDAVWDAARDAAWGTALGTARGAILALIAWDDAALLLIVPVPTLRLLSDCGSHSATLMLPAAIAFGDNS